MISNMFKKINILALQYPGKTEKEAIDSAKNEALNNHLAWKLIAKNLNDSSNIISENKNLIHVSTMLKGMCIECLLKCYYIKSGNKINEKNKLNSGHNLEILANQVKFQLTEKEKKLLQKLSFFIERGRYPTFQKNDKYEKTKIKPKIGKVKFEEYYLEKFTKTDSEIYNKLITKLYL